MNNEAKKRLLDALEACRAIQQFTAGSNFVSYTTDSMRRAAVERKFEILGEALSRAEESAPELTARLPDVRRIIGMRNGSFMVTTPWTTKLFGTQCRAKFLHCSNNCPPY
jgi:uncharacterized protein with HEPN domain